MEFVNSAWYWRVLSRSIWVLILFLIPTQLWAGTWGSDGYRGNPDQAIETAIPYLDCARLVRHVADQEPSDLFQQRTFEKPIILGAFQNPDVPSPSLYVPNVRPGFRCDNAEDARRVLDAHPGNFVLFVASVRGPGRINAILAQIPSLHLARCADGPELAKEPRCSLQGATGVCLDRARSTACRKIGYYTSWQTFTNEQDVRSITAAARTVKTPVYFIPGGIDLHHRDLGKPTHAIDFTFYSDSGIIFMGLFLTSLNPMSESFWSRQVTSPNPSSWAPPAEYFWIRRVDERGPVGIPEAFEEADRILSLR